jgi:arylsulfatase A-like enzyme
LTGASLSETDTQSRLSAHLKTTKRDHFPDVLMFTVWVALFSGQVEGFLLIVFQRLNWRNWGAILHASAPIIWISPLVDLVLFTAAICLVTAAAKVFSRMPLFATTMFVLAVLTAYDWLTCIGRLKHWSCALLAIGLASAFTRWATRNESRVLRFCRWTTPAMVGAWMIAFAAIHLRSSWLEQRHLAVLRSPIANQPNVLFVVFDTLRADHVSAYGYPRETSPTIDRLAREGVLFENAIAPAPWSLPSHVSLLTGKYQFEHGIGDVPPMSLSGLRAAALNASPSLAEVLEQHGYRTGAFSANRTYFSANLGFAKGFSHFDDYYDSVADCFVRTLYGREFARIYLTRTDRSAVRRFVHWLGWESLLDKDDEGAAPGGTQGVRKRAPEVNREVLRWIDSSPHDRAFFAMLNYFDVHHRYGGPVSYHGPWADLDASGAQQVINEYDDGIKYDDDALGDLLQSLGRRGLLKNTLVVVTSDHGESLGEHHIAYHGEALYREQIYVPLVFWFPGHVPAGTRVPNVVTNASIPATVLNILKLAPVADFKRPPLDVLWEHPAANENASMISEVAQIYPTATEDLISEKYVPTSMQGAMKSLTTERWQLITHERLGTQLYDYKSDPAELKDRYNTTNARSISDKLARDLSAIVSNPTSAH